MSTSDGKKTKRTYIPLIEKAEFIPSPQSSRLKQRLGKLMITVILAYTLFLILLFREL